MTKGYFIPVFDKKRDSLIRYDGVTVEIDPENPKGKKTAIKELMKKIDKKTEKIKPSLLKHIQH